MASKGKNWAAIRKINARRAAKRNLVSRTDAVASYIRSMSSQPSASAVRVFQLIRGMSKAEKIKALQAGIISFAQVSDAALWSRGQL